MKSSRDILVLAVVLAGIVTTLAADLCWGVPTPTPSPVVANVAVDTDWDDLDAEVKAGRMTGKDAHAMGKAIERAIKTAHEQRAAGQYLLAAQSHPLTYCKAIYTLDALREAMGGTRGPDGRWSGYNVDKDGKFKGTAQELAECRQLASNVRNLVAEARRKGRTGPKNQDGTFVDSMTEVVDYVQGYETGILR